MAQALLIYDGRCAYCRGFAQLAGRLDPRGRLARATYDHLEAQALLQAQFGSGYGLAMYLFEKEQVSWGGCAAKRLVRTLALPSTLGRLAFRFYPGMVWVVSRLSRRAVPVCGPDCAVGPRQRRSGAGDAVPLRPQSLQLLGKILLSEREGSY